MYLSFSSIPPKYCEQRYQCSQGRLDRSVTHYNCICDERGAWLFAVHQPDNINYSYSLLTGSIVTWAISAHSAAESGRLTVVRLQSVPVNALLPRITGMTEKTPLFHYRFNGSTNQESCYVSQRRAAKSAGDSRKLGVLFGVVVPTLLSMFSVVVFLRIGELKSQMFFVLLFSQSDYLLYL